MYYCNLEEHIHIEDCFDADGNLTCTLPAHLHSEECAVLPTPAPTETPEPTDTPEPTATPEPASTEETYLCGLEEHTHGEACYDEEGNLICELPEHVHSEDCLTAAEEPAESDDPEYTCGLEEHTHVEACYDENGELICGLEEHVHGEGCLPAPEWHVYDALDGAVTAGAECEGELYAEHIPEEDPRYAAYADALMQALAEYSDGETQALEIYDIAYAAADGTHPTVALTLRLDAAFGGDCTLLVAHLAQSGWEWLPCTWEEADGAILLRFETASFSPFAVLAVGEPAEPTTYERLLAEISALVVPAEDADEASVAAYDAAVAELRAQLAQALENGELTDEEYAALLALLPPEQTIYEMLLAEVEALESRGSRNDAMVADGEALLERIRLAWERGELTQEECEELTSRVCILLYYDIAEHADGDSWLRLKNSGWFQAYSGSSYTALPDSAAQPLPTAAPMRMARAASVMSLSEDAADTPTSSQSQVNQSGGTNTSADNAVSVSKTIAGTDLENVFDITLQVQTTQKIEEVYQEPDMAVVIVMDISNTMNEPFGGTTRYKAAMDAAENFLDQFTENNSLGISKVGFVAFNTNAHQIFDLQQCATAEQANALKSTMRTQTGSIINASGYNEAHSRFTNIEAGLAMASDMLNGVSNRNKYIIFLSDGFPTTYISSGYSGYDPYDSTGRFYDHVLKKPCTYGTSYSDKAAIRARNKAAKIKASGTTIFSIGVDVAGQTIQTYITQSEDANGFSVVDRTGTTYEIGDASSTEAYKDWLRDKIGSGYYYDSTDSAGLRSAFNQIFATIKKEIAEQSEAKWVVGDPLPQTGNISGKNVEFIGFYNQSSQLVSPDLTGNHAENAENTASFVGTDQKISWDLKKSGYKSSTTGSTTTYTYSLVYRVRLRNEDDGFVEGTIYPTNGTTTLTYQTITNQNGNTVVSGDQTLDFPIPSVHGYLVDLIFEKVDSFESPVPGAEFTLAHNTANCSICRGDKSSVNILTRTATSGADGTVSFTGIPSGHIYTLKETKVPDGYWNSHGPYQVTVAYDGITIDGVPKPADWQVVNNVSYELPQTGGSGTIWYTAGGTALLVLALLMYKKKRQRGCN